MESRLLCEIRASADCRTSMYWVSPSTCCTIQRRRVWLHKIRRLFCP